MAGRVAFVKACARQAGRNLARRPRAAALVLALQILLGPLPPPAAAQVVKGTVSAAVENGFARLIFSLGPEVESQAHLANNVIVVNFSRPVEINIDRLRDGAAEYIAAARRDPDGKAVRIALTRHVTLNSMVAGERLYVDLLPEGWSGLPPGLPREVIEELARRARDAEKKLRQDQGGRDRKVALIRVRVATQPTFTRYVFQLPEPISIAADNRKDALTLTFNAPLNFDLADAKAALPASLQSIDSEVDRDTSVVRFALKGTVDVRTFREENNYVADIGSAEAKGAIDGRPADELAALAADLMVKKMPAPASMEAPQTVPAQAPDADAPRAPATGSAAPSHIAPSNMAPIAPSTTEPKPAPAPARAAAPPAPAAATNEAMSAPMAAAPAAPQVAPPSPPIMAAAEPPNRPTADEPPAQREGPMQDPSPSVKVVLQAQGENLSLRFPFAGPTPAAIFRRADVLWLVFDTSADIGLAELANEHSHTIKSAAATRQEDAAVVRIKLERPRLVSVTAEGSTWVVNIGSQITDPIRALAVTRNGTASSQAGVMIAMAGPRALHRLDDPEAGDALLVVTALAPARGFVNGRDFVEFRVLPSAQGIVVQPLADDLSLELSPDRVSLTRPNGLTLSGFAQPQRGEAEQHADLLDPEHWIAERKNDFGQRESQLLSSAAKAGDTQRLAARVDLARFYLAWGRSAEAKGVLDVAIKDNPLGAADPVPVVLRAVADILLERPQEALKDLAGPQVGNQYEAPLWRAWSYALLSRWADASDGFRDAEQRLPRLPVDLQRQVMQAILRVAIEVGDITSALNMMHGFEVLGVPRELQPIMAVYGGELAERLGRTGDALQSYQLAADSRDRPAAAQGQLRQIKLRNALGKLARADAIDGLERLTTIWRGDDTEIEALKLLAHLYTEEGRYRDSFHLMRTALTAYPGAEKTRGIQDEAAETFEGLFLAGRGDGLSAIDALALFYDFRDLTPIGRRGDEMIRRLADRLVAVDLLDQAAELLQYQVENRLQGAARAQVAMRLATIYLSNHRPDAAFKTLRTTRVEDVSNELRQQRLLIEARAVSDSGRHDLALEIIANIAGPQARRLRADILWAAQRWQEAAEQIEASYGDRWQDFAPLDDTERADLLRAAAGYALSEDALGLARFRERYAGKMGEGRDRRAFDVITEPVDASGTDFRAVAHAVAAVDTLSRFLRDMQTPPQAMPMQPPASAAPAPAATGSTPPAASRTAAR